jgi:hypothetical protein
MLYASCCSGCCSLELDLDGFDGVGLERVGPEGEEPLVAAGAGVDEAVAEEGAHAAADVLVGVDVEEGVDGRVEVAQPPDHERHVVRN